MRQSINLTKEPNTFISTPFILKLKEIQGKMEGCLLDTEGS